MVLYEKGITENIGKFIMNLTMAFLGFGVACY